MTMLAKPMTQRHSLGATRGRPSLLLTPSPLDGRAARLAPAALCPRSEEHTSELQSHVNLVCRLLLEKKKTLKQDANSLYSHPPHDLPLHHRDTNWHPLIRDPLPNFTPYMNGYTRSPPAVSFLHLLIP